MKLSLLALGYGLPPAATASIAGVIFVATLVLIMLRPKQLNEALAALGGGLAMIVAGLVTPLQTAQTLLGDWNIFLFFLGMLALSALAERAGFFDWLAARAAGLATGVRAASISMCSCWAFSFPPFSPMMPRRCC
ncbi:MAG TPA: SLC13 family permease [Ktedonobacterales bacterium]|nr:SLC13 family permease [Ktedonobacterales bacterium]